MPLHATQAEVRRRPGGWRKNVVIFNRTALIPATPGAILIDEEIDLGPYGLHAVTPRNVNLCIFIEKPDGLGGWVVTNAPRGFVAATPPSGLPAPDPMGYEVDAWYLVSPMARPHAVGGDPLADFILQTTAAGYTRGQDTGRDVTATDVGGTQPLWAPGGQPARPPLEVDRPCRLRVVCFRSGTVYSPEDQATIDALGYRVRVYIEAIDQCVWEREVPIGSAAQGDILLNEDLDLTEYGMVTDEDRFVFVADIRRNGRVVRVINSNEYVVGEAFDPPAPPVQMSVFPVIDGSPWWNEQNENEAWEFALARYGSGDQSGMGVDYGLWGGTWLGAPTGNCSESVNQALKVLIWRTGAIPSSYVDGRPGVYARLELGFMTLRSMVAGAPGIFTIEGIYDGPLNVVDSPTGITMYAQNGDTLGALCDLIEATGKFEVVSANRSEILNAGYFGWWPQPTPGTIPNLEPMDTPVDAADGTTVRLRLLFAAPNRIWDYPFTQGGEQGVRQILLQNNPHNPTFTPSGLHILDGYLKVGGSRYPTAAEAGVFLFSSVGTGADQTVQINGKQEPAFAIIIPTKWPGGSAVESEYSILGGGLDPYAPYSIRVRVTSGVSYSVFLFF